MRLSHKQQLRPCPNGELATYTMIMQPAQQHTHDTMTRNIPNCKLHLAFVTVNSALPVLLGQCNYDEVKLATHWHP